MIINGVELKDLDVADVFEMEKYEQSLDDVTRKVSIDIRGKKHSELLRLQCKAVFDFFEDVFGEGTAKKIFGESVNLSVCMETFSETIDQINKLKNRRAEEMKTDFNRKLNVYQNRQQRRQNNKKKKHYNNVPKLVK